MRKILISGATGNTGFPTVKELSQNKDVEIIALTRDKNGARAEMIAELPNVKVVEADLSKPETLTAPLHGVSAVMVATPWNDLLENEINIINASIRQGVEFLLKISTTSSTMREDSKVGYARKHLLIEKYLNESGNIKWAALRPNEFLENRLGLAQVIKHQNTFPSIQGESQSAMVSTIDIGKIASAILLAKDWSKYNGKSMVLSGKENVSDAKFASLLTEYLNKTIAHKVITEKEMAQMFFGESVPTEIVEQMKEFNGNVQKGKHTLEKLSTDPLLLELHEPQITMEELIQSNIQLFK